MLITSNNAVPLSSEILPRGNLGIPRERNWISIDPGWAEGCSRNRDYCTIQGPCCQEDTQTCFPLCHMLSKAPIDKLCHKFLLPTWCSPAQISFHLRAFQRWLLHSGHPIRKGEEIACSFNFYKLVLHLQSCKYPQISLYNRKTGSCCWCSATNQLSLHLTQGADLVSTAVLQAVSCHNPQILTHRCATHSSPKLHVSVCSDG